MLVIWQTVELAKEQLQLTLYSNPLTGWVSVHGFCLLHGSASLLKSQFVFPSVFAMSAKGFSERLVTASRPAIGLMFKQVKSFVHRMVDTLGASIFPNLPKALEQLLVDSEV
ncbi:exportin-T [Prunus yedoensis var. nudiflora]|uniref:Exportin-T n=1 Tax=Prunus yedoensis var. nudiflora TaxID=2094558 RepID=A0A314XNW0_PRUYE|nr:exportin-T [Prunus yedoensis var. nudiflora]